MVSVDLTTVVEFEFTPRRLHLQRKAESVFLNLYFLNDYFAALAGKDTVTGVFVACHHQRRMLSPAWGADFQCPSPYDGRAPDGIRIEANHVPGKGLLESGRGQVGAADTKWE